MKNSDIYIPWDGWSLVKPIGHGSFGKVYEIEKRLPGMNGARVLKAAMKVISIDTDMLDDMYGSQYGEDSARKLCEDSLRSIRREFDLMYELRNNPNIVRCDDMQVVGHSDGIGCDVYIMMELLTPLQKIWKSDSISEQDVMRLGEDICRALMVCEEHSIIHRDIKPQNILVTDNGTYKLGDFGTARTFEHTASATMAGTETYMAPEVIRREKYGRDVDTYSLGLVMYRMLNRGQLPFIDDGRLPTAADRNRSFQRRISGEQIPAPATGNRALQAVVLKACSYYRKDRYSSAAEMLEDIILAGEGTMPMFRNDDSRIKTVLDSGETGRIGKKTATGTGTGTTGTGGTAGSGAKIKSNNDTAEPGGKNFKKILAAVLGLIICIAGIAALSDQGSDTGGGTDGGTGTEESAADTDTDTDTDTEPAAGTTEQDSSKNVPYTDGVDEMAWIEYEMVDHPSKGSGQDNSDEYHSNYWTVYYDKDTGVFHKLVEEQWFDYDGYTEEKVQEYVDRITEEYSSSDYDFVVVDYKGPATGDFGTQYVLQVEYNNIDDPGNRILADHIFMAVDWGTTITEAEKTIKAVGGERYLGSITSEEDALSWAEYFANINDLIPSGVDVGYTVLDTTTDEAGHTVYQVKGFEDHPDNIATIFNWEINEYGVIRDMAFGDEINKPKYSRFN